MMRIGLDATELPFPRGGVGHATASLAGGLVEVCEDVEVVLVPFTVRSVRRMRPPLHPRIEVVRAPIPPRVARRIWTKATWPPIEAFTGPVDVFAGTNALLPPVLKGAGVLTVHDLAFVHRPQDCSPDVRSLADAVPVFCERAHRIVVPSQTVSAELGAWLPQTRDRIRVVPQGVREVFARSGGPLTPPRRDALGLDAPYVCSLGPFGRRKNIGTLLEAFGVLARKDDTLRLVLVGAEGDGWDEMAASHDDLLSGGRVVRTGYVPDAEAAAIVRGARVFAHPSRYEGFGMSCAEALAAGVPVVASDIPVLREVLGPHAEFVAPDDTDALAEALWRHLSEEPDADAIEAGRRHAAAYTWTHAARRTLEVYREAIGEASS